MLETSKGPNIVSSSTWNNKGPQSPHASLQAEVPGARRPLIYIEVYV